MDAAALVKLDDDLAKAIPPLTDQERSQLEASLLAEGCRDRLVVWRGLLLDGHHRREICLKHGIPFETVEVDLPDRDAAMLWVEENQLGRRNLTDDQRSAIAWRIQQRRSAMVRKERAAKGTAAREAKKKGCTLEATSAPKVTPERSRTVAAKNARVTEHKLRGMAEVAKAMPEAVDRIVAGRLTIREAQKQVRKDLKEQARASIPRDLPEATERYRVIHADIANVGDQVQTGSVDWIITDPPYEKEFLPAYDALGEFAARTLKPGGSLVCMTGQTYLPEVMASLCARLSYHWTLAYLTPGGQAVQQWPRKVNAFWKPLLWFTKGRYEGGWVGDVCRSAPNDNDKQHHRWGQSESGMADIVERFTMPGETICDPFCGGGTTGVVAVRKNRLFIGIDRDAEAVAVTKARLAEAVE